MATSDIILGQIEGILRHYCYARHDVIIFRAGAELCQISGVDTDTAD